MGQSRVDWPESDDAEVGRWRLRSGGRDHGVILRVAEVGDLLPHVRASRDGRESTSDRRAAAPAVRSVQGPGEDIELVAHGPQVPLQPFDSQVAEPDLFKQSPKPELRVAVEVVRLLVLLVEERGAGEDRCARWRALDRFRQVR